ncbi:GNAT family N-acetyltransferase [Saccharopolyspora cebuensis]|uniref:GNAT family N-acetyltransferase n=1 Tax=Saccharopolyspora cebuensis TaxID=418759 RepID=UPI0031EA6302
MNELELRNVSANHPDALYLVRELESYQVALYGHADPGWLDPARFMPPVGLFIVAYHGDVPISCGGCHVWQTEPLIMEIKKMFTVPAWRYHGAGRRLLSRLESFAAESGAQQIVLESGEKNTQALKLYRAAGYRPISAYVAGRTSINRAFGKVPPCK